MKILIAVLNMCFLMACNAQSPKTKLSYADMLRKEFPQLATDLTNQGIAFSNAQKMTQAEAAFRQAIALRRQLDGL